MKTAATFCLVHARHPLETSDVAYAYVVPQEGEGLCHRGGGTTAIIVLARRLAGG
jgi:hypothetical protein